MNAPFRLCNETVLLADLRDPGESARIEAFAAELHGTPFHRPAWLRAIERATGQRALGLVAEKGGQLTGWLPLTEVHSSIFGRALVSSGFAVGGGVLADSPLTAHRLCSAAEELAVRRSCPTVELRGGMLPESWEVRSDSHCNFSGALAEDDAAQLLAIPRKQRAEVRKGLDADLEWSCGRDEPERVAHLAAYSASMRNLGTPMFPRSLFDAVLAEFGEDADITTVRHKGEPVSSVLTLYHHEAAMPYWGGGTVAARHLRANERLYYELMCHARRRGCTVFDYGRSKTGSGPYRFKKNWGFDPEPLAYATWTAPGQARRNIDPTDKVYSAKVDLWKRLPLAVANRLGPPIARGLA